MSRRTINVIGIGMGGDGLTVASKKRIEASDIVIGAKRMVETVGFTGPTLTEYRSDTVMQYLKENPSYANISVLMSGDVGFYSGARKLLEAIDRNEFDVNIEPGISSVVYLCSKLGIPWQDVRLTSAHGRDSNLIGLSRTHHKVFTLLYDGESVHSMAERFVEYGMDVTITVGEDLGYRTERLFTGKPGEIMKESFGKLCVALIVNDAPDLRDPMGIPDEEFIRGDAPMTKSEVRTLSVAKLKLQKDSVIYDIGAGTGSVSIEMALVAVEGMVYAIEKEDAAADLIEENKLKFKTPNVTVVRGKAPEAMEGLPAPTHLFIGGSSGNMKDIVGEILKRNPSVRLVITAVTIETMAEISEVAKQFSLAEEDVVCVNISKARKLGSYHLMTAQNPVYIATLRGN